MPNLIDIILVLLLALAILGAIAYIVKAKKSGKACIGCGSDSCHCSGTSSCHCGDKKEK